MKFLHVFQIKILLLIAFTGFTSKLFAQVDTEFWFVVPEISHRGDYGGKPGTLRLSTLELEATVTIEMPANPAFTPIKVDIPANEAAAIDLSYLIDDVANPNITGLENKPLTPDGVNPFGLHITATNMINAYWEVNYIYGADIWSLKGANGLGTLFYTPFQTLYTNHMTLTPSYSAIDVVATKDNTILTFKLPDGVGASYGEPMTALTGMTPGRTFSIGPLDRGETFSLFPYLKNVSVAARLAGTRIESNHPIAVTLKDDNLNTASQGRSTIGDQNIPVNITGDTYVVPAMGNPNMTFVLATQDNTSIFVNDVLYTTLNEGEQVSIQSPNNQVVVISSKNNFTAPQGPPIYVLHLAINNMTRAASLLPPIGCTGNTQLSFSRAREEIREQFYFFLITENVNVDKFMIDGAPADPTIIPNDLTKWDQLGNGWSAYMTSNIPGSKITIGQHLVENSGGIFHLAVINGFTSANLGDMFYGYFSDYGGLNVGAVVAGTNSLVIRACYGTPVQLHAYGGTNYEWTPQDYLDDPYSNLPFAINLPAGAHEYTAHVSGACGSGEVPLTVLVAPPVTASFVTNVTSGCSPLTVEFVDQSIGNVSWQYDLGDGSPLIQYDSLTTTTSIGLPPDPFEFSHTYVNNTNSVISFEITLLVKNSSACAEILRRTIMVFPEISSDFSVDPDISCDPLESYFTNLSTGDTATWRWEFGDGGSSSERDPVHLYRNLFDPDNLVFDASLIAISPYNCRDTSTRSVTVKPYIEAMFTYDTVAECSPHEIIITDQSIGADHYQWDFGDGNTSTSTDPVISHLYVNTGPVPVTYTITLDVSNDEGCTDRIQREVTIYPEVTAGFTVDPPEVCSPAEVVFNNTSKVPPGTIYVWDFGDGGSSTAENPVHKFDRSLIRHDTTFTVTLVAITREDCRDTAAFDVVVHPYIEAAFTIEDVVGCDPFTVEIENKSIGVDSYHWDFGDGNTSSLGNPLLTHVYNNPNSTTSIYPLQLIATNTEGCSDTLIRNIKVHPLITANYSFTTDVGCHPLTVDFTDLSENAEIYIWEFGDGASSTQPSPSHTFSNFGNRDTTYTVTLTTSTTDGECVKSISWDFTVHPSINAEFTFPKALDCSPFEVRFENISTGGVEFRWDFGDGNSLTTLDTLPVSNIFVNAGFSGIQEFEVILIAESFEGCRDTANKKVSVYPVIESNFTSSSLKGCHPLDVDFTDGSSGTQTYIWDFGDGSSSNFSDPSHTFTNTGTVDSVYTVTLTTVAPNNICRDTYSLDITVHPYIQADFTIPVKSGCNPLDVTIENSTVNGLQYYWDFGDGSDTITDNLDSFSHLYNNSDFINQQEFLITLTAENFAGCTSTRTRTVSVEPDINAAFTVSRIEGCHPLEVDFFNVSEGSSYYLWDFGNGTTASLTNPSKTFNNLGTTDVTYRVWLYAFAPNNVCSDSFFIDIVVHPYIKADFTFEDGIQCTPSVVEFNNASIGGETFSWNFGDGKDTTTTSMSSVSHAFTNTNYEQNQTYIVMLTIENLAGCTDTISKKLEVYPNIEAAFASDVIEGCHPLNVGFSDLSSGGDYYKWNFDDGSSSNSRTPVHTFTNFTDSVVTRQVQLSITSVNNCADTFARDIKIHPKPLARFDTDKLIDCAPFGLPLVNTSLNGDEYRWEFGDGNDTTINTLDLLEHQYDNLTPDIATYPVKLVVSSSFGCVDSSQQNIFVYPRTYANFSVNDAGCTPHAASFMNQSVRGYTYQWDFGDGSFMSSTNPSNVYFNFGGRDTIYEVTLTSTSRYGCKDTMLDTIHVYAQPQAEFTATPTHQEFPSSVVELENLTPDGVWSYKWDMGDGNSIEGQNPTPYKYAHWGDYDIKLVTATPYCSDSISHKIRIFPTAPVAKFDTVYAECAPLEVHFANYSLYADSYLWDFDDGTTSNEFEPYHVFEEDGIYNVKLTIKGEGGIDYFYRQVEVYRNPIASFNINPDTVMLPDQITRFFNTSKYGDYFLWDFGDGNSSSEQNTTHIYEEVGLYTVTLDVTTINGCTDRLEKPSAVTVRGEGDIVYPNAFKPNMSGPSGGYYDLMQTERNEIFHPHWIGVRTYLLEIYNRWGEKLFESNDVNIGWDGYFKGKLSPQGVYIWKVSGQYNNGEPFSLVGDVTLLHDPSKQ